MKGLPATVAGDGSSVGTVARAFLDPVRRQIVGFGIDTGGGLLSPESSLLADTVEVRSLGPHGLALITPTPRGNRIAARYGELIALDALSGREVYTADGRYLGHVVSSEFDERTFTLAGIEDSAGSTIPVGQVVTVGSVVVVAAVVGRSPAEPGATGAR